ncbi:MAG: RDD family protein [Verrucomicrobiota bacterium]
MKPLLFKSRLVALLALACALGNAPWPSLAQQTQADPAIEREAAAPTQKNYSVRLSEVVQIGQDFHLKADESCREVVIVGGDAIIDGEVRRDVVVVFGKVKVNGTVGGDLVNVLGGTVLGPNAMVEGDATVVGGRLERKAGAHVGGEPREILAGENIPSFQWVADWVVKGLMWARPLPPQFAWVWTVAAIFLVLYVLMMALFPRPVQACVDAMDRTPVGTFFTGVLGLISFPFVLLLLVVTGVGVLIIPFLFVALAAAFFFGKISVYRFTGLQLARQLHAAVLEQPLVALIIGILIFYLLYMVPVLGLLAWMLATIWGLGSVLMATFSALKRERAPATATIAPAPTYAMAAPAGTAPVGGEVPPPLASSIPLGSTAPVDLSPATLLTMERAGFWIRTFATLIDLILVGVIGAIFNHGVMFPLLLMAYHLAFWTWKQTTLGGIVFGLKLVRLDGRPIDFAVALVRTLSALISAVFLFLGFFWVGWDAARQSWHDKIAGTVIVKVPKGISLI